MRRIGVAVVIALNLLLAPLAVEAQQPAEKVYRVGWIGASLHGHERLREAQRVVEG